MEKNVQDNRRRIWLEATKLRFGSFDELNAWLRERCQALWHEIGHLLQTERAERTVRTINHQMKVARFPVHRDLAGFDFTHSCVERRQIEELADLGFTETAQNAVLIGGPGTGKTHLATALGAGGINHHGRRVRFYSTVDLGSIASSRKRLIARRAGLRAFYATSIWSSWTNWVTCPLAKAVGRCCFIFSRNSTSTRV